MFEIQFVSKAYSSGQFILKIPIYFPIDLINNADYIILSIGCVDGFIMKLIKLLFYVQDLFYIEEIYLFKFI